MAIKIKPYKVHSPDAGMFTETVKYEVLACGNVNSNNNKFYCIELQKNPATGNYRLFTHYGRIGKTNVYEIRDSIIDGAMFFDDGNLYQLEAEYDKILKKKKRIAKGKSPYQTVDTQEPTVGSENIRNQKTTNSTGSASKGDLSMLSLFDNDRVKSMVRSIWEENIHNITNLTTMTVSSSGISTPLGALTLPHVELAAGVLEQIKDAYNSSNRRGLNDLNSQYFSMIPHPFGHKIPDDALIDDDNKFLVEFDLLKQMKAAVQVGGEEATDEQLDNIGFSVDIVDKSSSVWKTLNDKYITSRATCHSHLSGWNIKKIYDVSHHKSSKNFEDLDNKYKKTEYTLFHGSMPSNILSILMSGFYVPPATASHCSGRMFGNGVYGASASTKALNYATGYWNSRTRSKYGKAYVFIVQFAMGNIYYPRGTMYNGPPSGYDSIWAKAKDVSLANDEFIVYNLNQAKMTHLLEIEKC